MTKYITRRLFDLNSLLDNILVNEENNILA